MDSNLNPALDVFRRVQLASVDLRKRGRLTTSPLTTTTRPLHVIYLMRPRPIRLPTITINIPPSYGPQYESPPDPPRSPTPSFDPPPYPSAGRTSTSETPHCIRMTYTSHIPPRRARSPFKVAGRVYPCEEEGASQEWIRQLRLYLRARFLCNS